MNLASRLEGLNKTYKTDILIAGSTYELVRDRLLGRPIDRVQVKGKTVAVLIYELLCEQQDASEKHKEIVILSHTAFDAYMTRDFVKAAEMFAQLLDVIPGDVSSVNHLEKCREYIGNPPPADWDPSVVFLDK